MAQSSKLSGAGNFANYWPLIALTGVSCLVGVALMVRGMPWMPGFMGVFLVIFALLKIFDLRGFQRGFTMYDIGAKAVPAYGYLYPFIELGLGLMFLSGLAVTATAWVTIVVFSFGTIGVLRALSAGLNINCPCMGSILSVPLSSVTLTEDITMIAMAAWMLSSG